MDEAIRQYQQDIIRAQHQPAPLHVRRGAGRDRRRARGCGPGGGSTAPSGRPRPRRPRPRRPSPRRRASAAARAPAPAAVVRSSSQELFLFNWSDYFRPDNKTPFKKTTAPRHPVRHLPLERGAPGEAPGRRQGPVRHRGPDRRVRPRRSPTAASCRSSTRAGCPNLATVNQQFKTLPFDPNDEYIVPKDWGTTGIIYRGKDVKEPVTSLEGLLRPGEGQVLGQGPRRRFARRRLRRAAAAARLRRQHHRQERAGDRRAEL